MIKEVTLNVKEAVKFQVVSIMQGDEGVDLICRIKEGDAPFAIDQSVFTSITLEGQTAQKHPISLRAKNVSENAVTFHISRDETNEAGDAKMCVVFASDNEKLTLSTYPFIMKTTENPSYTAVENPETLKSLTDYINQAKQFAERAENTVINLDEVSEAARKAIDGVASISDSEKHVTELAGQAEESKAGAAQSAETATEKADAAKASEESAAGSASSAEESARLSMSYAVGLGEAREGEATDNAKYYKEMAEQACDTAVSSSETATAEASRASESAAAALASQGNAAESEQKANTSMAASKESEENARVFSSSAAVSAKEASDSAESAGHDAKLAQSYAVGTGDMRDGEASDNAKYYCEISRQHEERMNALMGNQMDILAEVNKKLGLVEFSIDDECNLVYNDNSGYNFGVNDDGELTWEVA